MRKRFLGLIALPFLITSCGENGTKYSFKFTFNNSYGEVSSNVQSGTYKEGTEITLKATPLEGYCFDSYFDVTKQEKVSSETTYTFKLTQDIELEVKFSKKSSFPKDDELKGTFVPGTDGILPTVYKVPSPEEYYKDFNFNLAKEDLRKEIRTKTKVKNYFSYSQTSHALRYIDESLTVPGKLYGVYDAKAWDNTWEGGRTRNKEHVWPQSKFKGLTNATSVKGDIHNLRICTNPENSYRGNKFFDELDKEDSNHYFPNKSSDAKDDFRGDVARICFYMYGQYANLHLSDNPSGELDMGILYTMLERNKDDPVDEFERQRNMKVSMYQGNRNIFIDFPDLVYKLF